MFKFFSASTISRIAAILLVSTIPGTSQSGSIPPSVSPLARYFVLADLGARAGDPKLQQRQSFIAEGGDGYLYTTAAEGGANNFGAVFRFSPGDGKPPEVRHSFDKTHDGATPIGGLLRGTDGNLYGTTYAGGKYGSGTMFRISPDGAFQFMLDFPNGTIVPAPVNRPPREQEIMDAAAAYPVSPPVQIGNVIYGAASTNAYYNGVIYQVVGGRLIGVHLFKRSEAASNGAFPYGLSAGTDGSLYGTTMKGGLGWGTIFKLTGGAVTTLYKFDANSSGSLGVIQARDGYLYGAATGPNTSFGMVYRLNPDTQEFKIIHCFDGNDGAVPVSGLTEGTDGGLYGVTYYGGKWSRGAIYRVDPDPKDDNCAAHPLPKTQQARSYADMFDFNMNTGRYAQSPLFEHTMPGSVGADFYGVTNQGGPLGFGILYRVNVRKYQTPARDALIIAGMPKASDTLMLMKVGSEALVAGTPGQWTPKEEGGVSVQFFCPRDPHIVQLIMRTAIDADGNPATGPYKTKWGMGRFGEWHTDAISLPNAYYDQALGPPHRTDPMSVTIYDHPQTWIDDSNAHGWWATARDFAICNGKVLRVATWSIGANWDVTTKTLGAPTYLNFQISKPGRTEDPDTWSTIQLQALNIQLKADGYDPVP